MKKIFWLLIIILFGYFACLYFITEDDNEKIIFKPLVLWNKIKDRILDKDLPVKKMMNSFEIDMNDVSSKSTVIEKTKKNIRGYTKDDKQLLDKIIDKIN